MTKARVTKICLAFPETTHEIHGSHVTYLAGKKKFAYYMDNHHGDGIVGIACKALPGDNARLIAADPDRYYMPAYVGPRGWVGLRLDRGKVDWEEVRELLALSYILTAPKRLSDPVRSALGLQ